MPVPQIFPWHYPQLLACVMAQQKQILAFCSLSKSKPKTTTTGSRATLEALSMTKRRGRHNNNITINNDDAMAKARYKGSGLKWYQGSMAQRWQDVIMAQMRNGTWLDGTRTKAQWLDGMKS